MTLIADTNPMIKVKNCNSCPFLKEHDMAVGYYCSISKEEDQDIPFDPNFDPDAIPLWCPLLKGDQVVIFDPL